jgi:site-specific recombinase XerD
MASLRKRGNRYYIVFSRRNHSGKLEQKVYSLRTSKKRDAEKLKIKFGEQFRLGEIDPWGDWTPKKAAEQKRRKRSEGTLQACLDRFLHARSHVQESTLKEYRARLEDFVREVGKTMPPRLVKPQDVREFAFKEAYSRATKRTYLRYCKMLFGYLEKKGIVESDPTEEISYPKKKKKVSKKSVSPRQYKAIVSAFKEVQRRRIRAGKKRGLHPWFRPLTAVAFYAGLRRSEIQKLTWDQIELDAGFITVTDTKNGEERAIPLVKSLEPILVAWHRLTGYPRKNLVFFKSNHPGQHSGRRFPLRRDHITKTFKAYAQEANMPKEVTFHGLRHSFVTVMLREGMDLHEVSEMAGHKSLEITRTTYAHLSRHDLKKKVEQLGI